MAIISCLDLNWVQIGPKMAILVTGNGNYNLLFSIIFKIFDYFCTVVPYFWVILVNSRFEFTSTFVSQNFCEYGTTVYFRVQIRIRKKFCFVFCKNGKSGKKILSHCLRGHTRPCDLSSTVLPGLTQPFSWALIL